MVFPSLYQRKMLRLEGLPFLIRRDDDKVHLTLALWALDFCRRPSLPRVYGGNLLASFFCRLELGCNVKGPDLPFANRIVCQSIVSPRCYVEAGIGRLLTGFSPRLITLFFDMLIRSTGENPTLQTQFLQSHASCCTLMYSALGMVRKNELPSMQFYLNSRHVRS